MKTIVFQLQNHPENQWINDNPQTLEMMEIKRH
jgi:hypothetical protein